MSHDKLNAWIFEMKAQGYWVTPCAAGCGTWFAQLHKGRTGRRASYCGKHRCWLWQRWFLRNGRAPDSITQQCWVLRYGDKARAERPKKHFQPERQAA